MEFFDTSVHFKESQIHRVREPVKVIAQAIERFESHYILSQDNLMADDTDWYFIYLDDLDYFILG
jgi:hypothetical protein